MKSARILLADDHVLLRAGIRTLLEAIPGIAGVTEADNGREAIACIAATHPDLVLMDIAMPEFNGLEALIRATKRFPLTRVVILTMHANEEYVYKAMRSGAAGYMLKNAKPSELKRAIEIVLDGGTFICPEISRSLDEYLLRSGRSNDPLAGLTPRQRETLQLLAEGQSTKEIADTLRISGKTVEMHRAHLMERLQIRDLAGLVRYAIRSGLVDSERF